LKSLGYLDAILGLAEARTSGADEALFLNTADRVASTSTANIFAVIDDGIITPPVSDGVLGGVMRRAFLDAGVMAGFAVRDEPLTLSDLMQAREIFTTNSVRVVQPVTDLDGRSLPGLEGPVVRAVISSARTRIFAACGKMPS
jgi:branched-chain amino acid aminotransferase